MHQDELEKALALLSLQLPVNREQLEQTRRDLLATWHPHRYANLTNNPKRTCRCIRKAKR